MAVAQRMYARALFEAAREADRIDAVAGDLGAIAGAMDEVPELRAFLRNPQIEPDRQGGDARRDRRGRRRARRATSSGSSRRRAAPASSPRSAPSSTRSSRRRRTGSSVELTTAHELSDDEATSIVQHDREGLRPQRRGDALRRPEPHRRHRPADRVAPRRRQRPRPPRAPSTRTRHSPRKELALQ